MPEDGEGTAHGVRETLGAALKHIDEADAKLSAGIDFPYRVEFVDDGSGRCMVLRSNVAGLVYLAGQFLSLAMSVAEHPHLHLDSNTLLVGNDRDLRVELDRC